VIDGLGAVQNVLLVGGTSEIGLAIADSVFSKNRGNRLIVSVKAESDVDRVRSELSHRYNGISIDVEVMNMLSSGSQRKHVAFLQFLKLTLRFWQQACCQMQLSLLRMRRLRLTRQKLISWGQWKLAPKSLSSSENRVTVDLWSFLPLQVKDPAKITMFMERLRLDWTHGRMDLPTRCTVRQSVY
jgi:hypothetical protein